MRIAKIFFILFLSLIETTDALSERKRLVSSLPLKPPPHPSLPSYSPPLSPTLSRRKMKMSSSLPLAVIHEYEELDVQKVDENPNQLPSPIQEIFFSKENALFKEKLKKQALAFAHNNAQISPSSELSLDFQYSIPPYNGDNVFPIPMLGIYNTIDIVNTVHTVKTEKDEKLGESL